MLWTQLDNRGVIVRYKNSKKSQRVIVWNERDSENQSEEIGWGWKELVRVHLVCACVSEWRLSSNLVKQQHSGGMNNNKRKSLRGENANEQSLPGWSCQWYMLVSKTKPCKSKYKLLLRRNCEWLGKTAIISSVMILLTDNRSNSRANTC